MFSLIPSRWSSNPRMSARFAGGASCATDEGVLAHDTDSERNSDCQRSWGCRDNATRRLDHSEIRYDSVERSTRYVACGVPHSLSVEESALYGQQLGKQRADDCKNHD